MNKHKSTTLSPIFVCGYPGDIGGANTELWHTVKLWRRFGLPVTLIPMWEADATWQSRLEAIGCRTVQSNPDDLQNVPGLRGSIVVAMCNTKFLHAAEHFRALRCRIVWVGCMNWLFPAERLHYRQHGAFDRHVFQSRYQRDQLAPQLRRHGFDDRQGCLIRGAFDCDEFPLRSLEHKQGEIFTIGRISRADGDKFSPQTWKIYGRVPHAIRARVMGWGTEVSARLGPPPQWAECLPPGSATPQEFLATLHAMVQVNGHAVENWPRVALEAMASGVPVVAERRGGWPEMICHGRTGFLCGSDDEIAFYTARLAYDEALRMKIIHAARAALVRELAEPETIFAAWRRLFDEMKD